MGKILTRWMTIKVAEAGDPAGAVPMRAFAARPEAKGSHPTILVLQEIFGVNSHMRDVVRRFARRGFYAISPELFHRTAPGFEGAYDNIQAAMPHGQALTVVGMEADLRSLWERLRTEGSADLSRAAAIGYCMGGRVAYLANSILPLKAAVSYYGGRIVPDLLPRASQQNGPILFFWGGKDKHIPPEQWRQVTDALTAAGKPFVNVEISEADHGFFNDERAPYHPVAAKLSWKLTLEFFRQYLGWRPESAR